MSYTGNKAKPKEYNGDMFDSTYEAMWAAYFHELGIDYVYSDNDDVEDKSYLPDFKIITNGRSFYVECKGDLTDYDGIEKVRVFSKSQDIVLLHGSFPNDVNEYLEYFRKGDRNNSGIVNSTYFITSGRLVRPVLPVRDERGTSLMDVYDIIQRPENAELLDRINKAFRKAWDLFYGKETKLNQLKAEQGARIKSWREALQIKGPAFVYIFADSDKPASYQQAAGIMSAIETGKYSEKNTILVEKMLLWIDELADRVSDMVASEMGDFNG